MQPRDPYFGSKAEQLRSNLREEYNARFRTWGNKKDNNQWRACTEESNRSSYIDLIPAEELRLVQWDNLRFVLPYVSDIHEQLGSRAVVAADHGDFFDQDIHPVDFRFDYPD
jgi:hypothetical protein